MPQLDLGDVRLVYSDQGNGAPVVLIHGSASDTRTWQQQIPAFAEHWRVIAYSRRFHAPNPAIAAGEDYAMTQHVVDLAGVVERLADGRAHLVGHSYGAYLALMLALQQPALVASLVLAEPPVIPLFTSFPPRPAEILRLLVTRPYTALPIIRFAATGLAPATRAARKGDMETAIERFGSAVLGAERLRAMSAERMAQARDNLSAAELLGERTMAPVDPAAVAGVDVPTLVVSGACSPLLFRRLNEHLLRLLPRARHATIAAASHNMHEEEPLAFNSAVSSFLQQAVQWRNGSRSASR